LARAPARETANFGVTIMARKPRNYADEYARRIKNALARGFTRSQARGHARANEAPIATQIGRKPLDDTRLQRALKELREKKSLTAAAKAARVSPERLRAEGITKGAIEKQGRRWTVKADLPRQVLIYTASREHIITVDNFDEARVAGEYMNAVGRFLTTADPNFLAPFAGASVRDRAGRVYTLETNPNALFRLRKRTRTTFEEIYRIVV
jgi:hypothetical protein